MSRHHHREVCHYPFITLGYGMRGYGGNTGSNAAWGLRWFYALLILIVIVFWFGRGFFPKYQQKPGACCEDGTVNSFNQNICESDLIDKGIIFVIVVFLLAFCGGCMSSGGYSEGCGYY